jgi:anti-anti-sigma factor
VTGVPDAQQESGLTCGLEAHAGWVVLRFTGELDFTHMDIARQALGGLVAPRHGGLAVDLRGVTFMDTFGVRMVLQAMHRAEACASDFALVAGSVEVQRVLDLVGLSEQMRVVDDPDRLPVKRGAARAVTASRSTLAVPPVARRPPGDLLRAIGDTPLVELKHVSPNPEVRLWAKLESLNPTGSVKDRVARAMIEDAEARGALEPGQTVLEPTSGNTGISLAMVCARKGYPLKVVLPANVTPERVQMLHMYRAQIVYSPAERGLSGAVELALEMAERDGSYYMPYQYGNPANPLAHYHGTAVEILQDLGTVAAFVAELGTGGTLMGTGRRLREELGSAVKIVAAEPEPGEPLPGLPSLDAEFVPPIIDVALLDRRRVVANRDAIIWTRKLLDDEGIFAGVSSGAIASIAVQMASELDTGNVVFMVCDDGWRYVSSGLHTRPVEEVVGLDSSTRW